jgi:hypothetical protein
MIANSIFNIGRYLKLHGFPQASSLLFRLTALLDQNNRTPAKQWLVLNQKFPGMGYIKVLKIMHQILKPKTYLEIGVFRGESFELAGPQTHAIGIDPAPKFKLGIEDNKEIYALTSDDFFSTAKKAPELKGKVDFALIDGLHTFEQVLKDFINVEKLTHKNSVLVFHDILPLDEKAAQKNRETWIWMGDVWKIFPCLNTYRSDLSLAIIPTAPSGLLIVTSLNSSSSILARNLNDHINEFDRLNFNDFKEVEKGMKFIGNNFKAIKLHLERYASPRKGDKMADL